MNVFDTLSWPQQDLKHDKDLEDGTNDIIEQISAIQIDKEIIVLDNTGDFNLRTPHPDVQVHESYGSWLYKKQFDKLKIFDFVKDKFNTEIHKSSAAETCSMCYNHGLTLATGDYILFQHNDTLYLNNFYNSTTLIKDTIKYLEQNDLEYLTIDAKPPKPPTNGKFKGVNLFTEYKPEYKYFADCYWFLTRRSFFDINKLWVDWHRGDCNHLATIFCIDNNLKYEHLPMFNEGEDMRKLFGTEAFVEKQKENYPLLNQYFGRINVHFFNDKPFLIHAKGGTGLAKVARLKQFLKEANESFIH